MPPSPGTPPGGDDAAALVAGGILLALVVIVIGGVAIWSLQGRRAKTAQSAPAQPLLVKSKSSTVASLSRPVGYGRRSGYAYAQVARSAHGAQPLRFGL